MAKRKTFSRKERVRLFELYRSECYLCGGKIQVGDAWEIEHVVAWELTRDDSDDNLRLAHVACHKVKTADDVRAIRKADRMKAAHIGAKKPSTFKRPAGVKFDWKAGRYTKGNDQ